METKQTRSTSASKLRWLVLLAPYIGLLWLPFYNGATPNLWGFPLFYWYQLAWVPLTSLILYFVYRGIK
jgi:hypothetical protein